MAVRRGYATYVPPVRRGRLEMRINPHRAERNKSMANGRRPRPVEHPLMGRRVRLSHTNDPHTELVAGDEGTVSFIDSVGTVHVRWDRGSSLGLIADAGDRWEVIDEDG